MEYYQKETNLLDVLISRNKNEGSLRTSFFTKPTDTYQLLHATLCQISVYKKLVLIELNRFDQMKLIYNRKMVVGR